MDNEIMSFSGKWMELEIMLSERMLSLIGLGTSM
jgi:hypothetical protein